MDDTSVKTQSYPEIIFAFGSVLVSLNLRTAAETAGIELFV